VSPEVQARYTATDPGVVELTLITFTGDVRSHRLAVLCEARAEPLVIRFELYEAGCSNETTINTWVASTPADYPAICGIDRGGGEYGMPAEVDASDSTLVFRGDRGDDGSHPCNASARDLTFSL
jgi:hypothetical protein